MNDVLGTKAVVTEVTANKYYRSSMEEALQEGKRQASDDECNVSDPCNSTGSKECLEGCILIHFEFVAGSRLLLSIYVVL